jgi:prepilin-type N-terminal cleavage/methylation domain-containing protein
MPVLRKYSLRKGFTLIELLLVIFILGLIYSLGLSGVELGKKKPKALSPLNLKSIINTNKKFLGESTLMCLDKCKSCYLRKGLSSPFKAYSDGINLTGIKAYTLDERESLKELEYGRYKDKKICLIIDFYKNGSSTPIILQDKEKAYFLPAFFGEAKAFDSPEDAKEYWMKDISKVANSGGFY